MKVCVSAISNNIDSQLDPRFGRCQYFIIVDTETLVFEAISNTAKDSMGGAGIRAAQIVTGKGVEAVITGNIGPNAFQALASAGVKVLTGFYGTVREAVEKYKLGELREVNSPTVGGHFGMGRGRTGRGRWR